jgi:hypothetical protein
VPREHGAGKHRRPTAAGFGSLSMAVDSKATLLAAPPSPGNPGAPPVAAALPPPADPAPRGPREVLAEANKLLSQGEVKDACARGEEAKRMGPTSPAA